MTKNPKASRSITFWALIIVFFLPLVLAVILYVTRSHWQLDSVPEGELINPPIELPMNIAELPRLWRVLYIAPDCTGAPCQLQLAKINSIHEGTGKNFTRVGAMLITTGMPVDEKLLENFSGIDSLDLSASPLEPGLFIMDPNGYLILKYTADTPGGIVLHDLRHLLKVSQIG